MQGDYFATRALVLACCRRADEAEHFSGLSESVTDQIDSRALLAYSRAIVAHLQDRADATSVLQFALSESQATGNFDALVCAYRAVPSLLRAVKKLEDAKAYGARRVILSVDPALGQRAGFRSKADPLRPSGGQLTHREHEVFDLLRQGLTNRQIGQSLWITESTAKAHVRHILAKLGARSRTEAARREPLSED